MSSKFTASPLKPLTSRKPSARTILGPTPGIQHIVEGYDPAEYQTYEGYKKPRGKPDDSRPYTQAEQFARLDTRRHNKGEAARERQFFSLQDARKRIKPIADPDAEKANLRRQSSRRRMRGRLGTLLSQRETLG